MNDSQGMVSDLLIREVANGWEVEKRALGRNPMCANVGSDVYVYNDLARLQKELPMLLGKEPKQEPLSTGTTI